MRAATLAAALILCAASPELRAQEGSPETQAVLAVEDAYFAAELARDEAALRRIVDDAFVHNRSDGRTEGKAALIDAIRRSNLVSRTIGMRTVLVEGDTAYVFGTAELTLGSVTGPPRISRLRYSTTYQRHDGVWRLLALHVSPRA